MRQRSWSAEGRQSPSVARGPNLRLRRVYTEPDVAQLLWLVAAETGVPPESLISDVRGTAQIALARQMLMYLVHVLLSFDYRRVGALLGRNRSTVTHACALIEDRRDDPDFERRLARIESRFLESQPEAKEASFAQTGS